MDFSDKVAVLTGGGSGIGEATAKRLAAAGAKVVICGRTQEKLDETAHEAAGSVESIVADISSAEDTQRLFRHVEERHGRLDAVFAHAGVNGVWAPIEALEPEDFEKTLRVNVLGTFNTIKSAVPYLRRQGGAVLVTSSINGTHKFTDVGSTAYSASKAGQIAMVKLLALELAEARIRVNAICPGRIETDIGERTELRGTEGSNEVARFPGGTIPLTGGAPGKPEDVAEVAAFLLSEGARHVTGAVVTVDGGQSILQG